MSKSRMPPGFPNATVWREKFLEHFAVTANVTVSARYAGVTRAAAYKARKSNKAFRRRWEEAEAEALDLLENEAFRRAARGTLKPVYQGGKKVGEIKEYSDALMVQLLRAHRPEKYAPHKTVHHSGSPGEGPPQFKVEFVNAPEPGVEPPAGPDGGDPESGEEPESG